MEDKELLAKEIIGNAVEATIAFSEKTEAPIDDIVYSSNLEEEEGIVITVLFAEVEQLKAMEENNLKDQFMSVFIKSMTEGEYPFGESPKMKFEFSVSI